MHGRIVGPTSNPFEDFFSIKTLLRRKDFPVRYLPTKLTIPICLFSGFVNIFTASSFIINFFVFELNVTKGSAV